MVKTLAGHLSTICEKCRIDALYVFGTRAQEIAGRVHGKAVYGRRVESDVDIGVQPKFGQRLRARQRVQLALDLEDLFGVRRVDLVVIPEADPFLALDVIRGELLYCGDPYAQAEYELYVLRRAGDLAYHERARRRQILGRA